jgi:hypothetical protein
MQGRYFFAIVHSQNDDFTYFCPLLKKAGFEKTDLPDIKITFLQKKGPIAQPVRAPDS